MQKNAVLATLEALIERLELVETQPFRVKAYQRLWEALAELPAEAWTSSQSLEKALSGKAGIGEGLRRVAQELYQAGTTALLEELMEKVPQGVLELRRLPGLGPKRVQELWRELHITSVDALAQAIERGKLNGRKGWTPALIERLLQGIAVYRAQRHLLLYEEALKLWEEATRPLQEKGLHIAIVGELRRALPLIEQIEGLIEEREAPYAETLGWRRTESGVLQHPTLPVKLYLASREKWGLALLEHTGPMSFWESLRRRLPSEIAAESEEAIFTSIGLPYILPAWRDWEDILRLAEKGQLPPPLTEAHIKGSVHVHTTYSDGADSLAAMAEAARAEGWKWLGIADHSQRATYARGLTPERLHQQIQEINLLNQQYQGTFTLLKGIEADILPDGSIDYDESVWVQLDYMVASIHEKLHMTESEAMQRIERALTNPYVRVLGHWTGRLLRNRPGYPIQEERVLDLCAEKGIAIEFNANPYRMEIEWRWVRRAAEKGVSIILTTDAHTISELRYWRTGLAVLQKGLLPPSLLLNAREEPPFLNTPPQRTPKL
ncbi:MAG: PHP domain-containing protein [Bacteroidia bacterium]|nr:PHP domain-containing protein [Bacteroidia bacterium]MCX7763438.1 PHP domain-containing protein [Bacteroidia bacterium]MDW8056985.1 PHP domain-containing protein [Bacteroidia bacterium]